MKNLFFSSLSFPFLLFLQNRKLILRKVVLSICVLTLLTSCNPKIYTNINKSYAPLDYKQEVLVIGLDKSVPDNSETLGQVKIGDTGLTLECGYDFVIEKAKFEARKVGGNAIKIIKHNLPTAFGSACHRITAVILKVDDIENYASQEETKEEVLLNLDYAVLNVYRYSGAGSLISYDLYLGDSLICRVRNNFKRTIHIKKEGLNTLWAKTEKKTEIPINVKTGKAYYLRCGISFGVLVGRPKLELINSKTGKSEFESFKAKNQ